MKLVYAVDKISYNDKDHVGVLKKVEAQMTLFGKNGIESTLCQYEWEGGYPQIEIEKDTDILYFRRIEPSVKMILKLRQLKKKSPKLRLVMEIPTYPFKGEERDQISLKKKINRFAGEKLLRYCVNRIVLIGQQKPIPKLYGIPTICANNGVDFDKMKLKESASDMREEIHILCVSGCFFWHGYDRVIEGLHQYYLQKEEKETVYFHIVGEGECLKDYQALAQKYGLLDKIVLLHGRKVGGELDALYNLCDIAVDSFGAHRKGLFSSASLKTREYAAKGIPMATSVQLDIQNEKTNPYIWVYPATDEAVDIQEMVDFYHNIYDGKEKRTVAKEIRDCFYPYCDWKFVFREVVDYMKK